MARLSAHSIAKAQNGASTTIRLRLRSHSAPRTSWKPTLDSILTFNSVLPQKLRATYCPTSYSAKEGVCQVHVMDQTAVYMCDKAHEKFFLDTKGTGWGSSLDEKHPDVRDQLQPVDVKVVNLMRLLAENVIEGDTVAVKMDIEGAEWDILPCLATSPFANLIDYLYLENHCPGGNVTQGQWCASKGQANNTKDQFDAAVHALTQAGVQMPQYFSPMLLQRADVLTPTNLDKKPRDQL